MSTQKTITLYETFESYDEFKTTFDAYCQLTHQVFTAVDSKKLKPKDSSQASEDLVKKFVYKAQKFDCIHGRKRNNGYVAKGIRTNTHSQKIGCDCKFRLNFNETKKLLEITIFEIEHNHPVGKDLFQHYPSQRKSSEDQMKKLVELHEKHGVKVSTLVNNFNDENEKALRRKAFTIFIKN